MAGLASNRQIEHLLRRAGFGARPDELDSYTQNYRDIVAKSSENTARVRGQLEMLRDNALGNFRDILLNIARDTAMLFWLDGRTNTRNSPQENFAREIMELFTVGVGHYTESDVYAGAR